MELTKRDITDFKLLYKKHFGVSLDDETAYGKLSLLIMQMKHVYACIEVKDLELLASTYEDENGESYESGPSEKA